MTFEQKILIFIAKMCLIIYVRELPSGDLNDVDKYTKQLSDIITGK